MRGQRRTAFGARRPSSRLQSRQLVDTGSNRWVLSYADLVTLLLAVFMVAFIMSKPKQVGGSTSETTPNSERVRTESVSEPPAVSAAPIPLRVVNEGAGILDGERRQHNRVRPIVPKPGRVSTLGAAKEWQELAALQRRIAALDVDSEIGDSIRTRIEPRGLVVSLSELGFFDSGSAEPRTQALTYIDDVARILSTGEHQLRIEGHTDDRPIRTAQFPSNWELSTARASGLVAYLVGRFGMNPGRLSAAGYGQFRPVATNQTAAGRALNRRVDLVLLSRERASSEEPDTLPALTR